MEALLRAWRFLDKKSDYTFLTGDFNGIVVFLFPVLQVSWNFSNPPRVLDLDDRQGLIASSAMQ